MTTPLLDQSAFEGVSTLIKGQVMGIRRYLRQIESQEREESLHDFRVSLRRLRIWLKVAKVDPALRLKTSESRRIKHLVQLTNRARDLEVLLALTRQHLTMAELDNRMALRFQSNLQKQIEKDYKHLLKAAAKDLEKIEPSVRALVSKIRKKKRPGSLSLKDFILPLLLQNAKAADVALSKIRSIEDKQQSHKARLIAKALRYLIEPFSDELEGSSNVLNPLRRLQDLLGGLRDAQMLDVQLDKTINRSQSGRDVQALKNAQKRNATEIHYLYAELQDKFLTKQTVLFQDKVEHLFLIAKI